MARIKTLAGLVIAAGLAGGLNLGCQSLFDRLEKAATFQDAVKRHKQKAKADGKTVSAPTAAQPVARDPALEGFLDPRGKAKDKTPLADFVLDNGEFTTAALPLSAAQRNLYNEALGVLARDAHVAAPGANIPQLDLDRLKSSVAWQLMRRVTPSADPRGTATETFYFVPRLAQDVPRADDPKTVAARQGSVLKTAAGAAAALKVSRDFLVDLGYDAPALGLGVRVGVAAAGASSVKVAPVRAKLTPEELKQGIEGRVQLVGDSVWLTAEQEGLYGALHVLLGPGEAAFRKQAAALQDAHYAVDSAQVYARGVDPQGSKAEIHAPFWTRSPQDPAARRLDELRNAIRLLNDAAHSGDYAARQKASQEMLAGKKAAVLAAASLQ